MTEGKNWTTLDAIVEYVINREGYASTRHGQLLLMAQEGYKELFRQVLDESRVVFLCQPNAGLKYVELPEDYDSYQAVGVAVKDNRGSVKILTLSYDPHLINTTAKMTTVCDCDATGCLADDIKSVASGSTIYDTSYYFGYGFRNGQYVGEYFGTGGGQSYMGSYRVDRSQNKIWLSSDVKSTQEIALKYTPTALPMVGGLTKIPDYAKMPLVNYVMWQSLPQSRTPMGKLDLLERNWEESKDIVGKIENGMTVSELKDAIYAQMTFTLQR